MKYTLNSQNYVLILHLHTLQHYCTCAREMAMDSRRTITHSFQSTCRDDCELMKSMDIHYRFYDVKPPSEFHLAADGRPTHARHKPALKQY